MKVIVAMLCTCASTIWMSLSAGLSNAPCFTICKLTQTCFESALRRGALRRGTPNFIQTSALRRGTPD